MWTARAAAVAVRAHRFTPPRQTKLRAAIDKAAFLPSPLSGVALELRDVDARPEWGARFGLEVPVVAWADAAGRETPTPRPPPRASADRVAALVATAKPVE